MLLDNSQTSTQTDLVENLKLLEMSFPPREAETSTPDISVIILQN